VVGIFLVVLWVGWWYLRWATGMAVFEVARDHLRDSLGFSSAVATVIATGTGLGAAFVLTVLLVKANYILAAVVAVAVLGLPLALLHDAVSADQCFNHKTGAALCDVWETPSGSFAIRRKDGAYPPSSWQRLRDATRADARAYLPSDGATSSSAVDRVPHLVALASCNPPPTFFDAAGQATVYWSRADDGGIELWNIRGVHPTTGQLLKPITPQIAKEVCAKLAAAQRAHEEALAREREETMAREREETLAREREETLAREREAEASDAQKEQEALLAERSQLQEQQAQQTLEAQRQQEDAKAHEQSRQQPRIDEQLNQRGDTRRANLVIHNKDCRAAYAYLNGQMFVNLLPGQERIFRVPEGHYMLRMCIAATAFCGAELPLDIFQRQRVNYISTKPGCD